MNRLTVRGSLSAVFFRRITAARGSMVVLLLAFALPAAAELVPPADGIQRDRPRLLLRPAQTRYAISLQQLKALPRDSDFQQMLQRLEGLKPPKAAALALVYQLTGRAEAAERALEVLRSWRMPDNQKAINDPFFVYFTLSDMALAYDWLHVYSGFDDRAKAALRQKLSRWRRTP